MSFVHRMDELVANEGNALVGKASHWERVPLGSVAKVINGFPFPSKGFNNENRGDPVIRIRDILPGKVETFFKGNTEGAPRIAHGDLVIGMDGDFNCRLWPGESALMNQRVCKLLVNEDFYSKEFLSYALPGYLKLINDHTSAITVKHLSSGTVQEIPLPLPPRREQDRLVSRLDELFSRIDEGERALERVSRLVERYRQSVLKAAVTGELTRDWREKHKHTLESGEALLARILTARREAWEQAELAKMQAKGITPKDDKWKRKYKAPTSPDTNDLPELPEGWVWASIEMLTSPHGYALKAGPFGSALKKSDYSPGGYKIYGQEQVIAGDWSIGDYYIGKDKFRELESCAVEAHDVLISLVGTIGKILVLPEECEPGIINPRLIKVSLNRMFYLPQFFKIYFESAFLKSLYKLEAHGATMDVLNLGIIKRLPFPLCSLEEQAQVIARSANEFDRADRLHEWVGIERKRISSFRQSVLKAAFSGHLVGQDPGDEPASVILKSIANERATSRAAPKRGRKKKITA